MACALSEETVILQEHKLNRRTVKRHRQRLKYVRMCLRMYIIYVCSYLTSTKPTNE